MVRQCARGWFDAFSISSKHAVPWGSADTEGPYDTALNPRFDCAPKSFCRATAAFDKLFRKLKDSIIVVSYSSNSLPTKDEIVHIMAKYKNHVEVVDIDHRYSFANQGHKADDNKNQVKEYLFIGH